MTRAGDGRARTLTALMIVVPLALQLSTLNAEDEAPRWSYAVSLGGANTRGDIASKSANVLTLVDENDAFTDEIIDPRNDNAQFGSLEVRAAAQARFALQYEVRSVLLEGSIGYQESDVRDIEAQLSFVNTAPPGGRGGRGTDLPDFEIFRVPAGDLLRVPVQFGALYRFRKGRGFRPFAGGGVGYAFLEFSTAAEFDTLSLNLDRSRGAPGQVTSVGLFGAQLIRPRNEDIGEVDGARIDVDGTFEWWLGGGADWVVAPGWELFVDFRFVGAANTIDIGFNGGTDLGVAVPQGTVGEGDPAASESYGPFFISQGGVFDVTGDGIPDTGYTYIQGGSIDLDAVNAHFGVRFTPGKRRRPAPVESTRAP